MAVDINTGLIVDIGDISTDIEGEEEAADQSEENTVATWAGDADSEDTDYETATEEESTVATCDATKEESDESEETTVAIYPICLGGGQRESL